MSGSLRDGFASMVSERIKIYRRTDVNFNGEATLETDPTTARCRIRPTKQATRFDREDAFVVARAYVLDDVAIATSDVVELPDGTRPTVIAVARVSDERGYHHTVLDLGVASSSPLGRARR